MKAKLAVVAGAQRPIRYTCFFRLLAFGLAFIRCTASGAKMKQQMFQHT